MSRPSTARTLGWLVLIVALMVATPVAAADEDPSAQLNDGSSETSVVDGEPSGEGSFGAAALPQGDCAGGEIYDDGVAENAYSGNPATVDTFDGVMLFTPQ
ncbi:MAG TPA: hypothetical protein VLA91_12345, partial [Acidimicrobiia bacterium]|nr:hypothetical protein [Acidimicrobiia bacterium]